MRFPRLIVSAVLLMTSFAAASTCPQQTKGAGPDVPCNVTANGVALVPNVAVNIPAYNGTDYNSVNVQWDTNNPADSGACVDYNVNGYSAATCQRVDGYDATLVTHHSILVHNFMPGKATQINVVSCNAACTGGWNGMRGSRFDPGWSVAPSGNQQASGYQVKIASPATGTPQWYAYVKGPTDIKQGGSVNYDVLSFLQSGSAPTYLGATSLQVDGQNCPAALPAAICGTTHVSVNIASSGAEIISTTNNYNVGISQTAALKGDYILSGVSTYGFNTQPGVMLKLTVDSAATLGTHHFHGVLSGADVNQNLYGSAATIDFDFTVVAPPTITLARPTTYPPMPYVNSYNLAIFTSIAGDVAHGNPFGFQYSRNASLTGAGIYPNDNYSSTETAFKPFDISNYNGSVIALNDAKWAQSIAAANVGYQSNHPYTAGDVFWDGSNVEVALTSGTSTAAPASWAAIGGSIVAGGVQFGNAGNPTWWTGQFQAINQLMKNWGDTMPQKSGAEEWNVMQELDVLVDYLLEGNVTNDNCDGSGHCTGLAVKALARLGYPIIPGSGNSTQGVVWLDKFVQNGTWRSMPYWTEDLDHNLLVSGIEPTNGGRSAVLDRIKLMEQGLEEMEQYQPVVTAANPLPCCISTPSFDLGLVGHSLITDYNVRNYLHAHGHPDISPDPSIVAALHAATDWFMAHEYNEMGNDFAAPYTLWVVPIGPRKDYTGNDDTNYTANRQLGMLFGLVPAWLGAMEGDGCYLQNAEMSCFAAADLIAAHTTDLAPWNGKSSNQVTKNWRNFYGWRSGTMDPTCMDDLPCDFGMPTPLPDKMEPYPSGEWPAEPSYTTPAPGQVVWKVYNNKHAHVYMKYGVHPNLTSAADCGENVLQGGAGMADTVWLSTCTVNGLAAGLYDVGAQFVDDNGNTGFSSNCVTCNGTVNWNFTITQGGSGGPTLSVVATPAALTIQQGAQLPTTVSTTIGGGFASSVALSVTGLPGGTTASFNPTTIAAPGNGSSTLTIATASTTPAGNYSLTVTASGQNIQATTTVALTVQAAQQNPPVQIPAQTLPDAIVGTLYNQAITVTGGVPPYSCTPGGILAIWMKLTGCGVSGTPTTAGVVKFSLRACDSESPQQCSGSAALQLTVDSAQTAPPKITTVDLPFATVGFPYATQLASSGGQGSITWSIASGTLPLGLNFNTSTGQIYGTPTNTASTVAAVTFEAQDQAGDNATPVRLALPSYLPIKLGVSVGP